MLKYFVYLNWWNLHTKFDQASLNSFDPDFNGQRRDRQMEILYSRLRCEHRLRTSYQNFTIFASGHVIIGIDVTQT